MGIRPGERCGATGRSPEGHCLGEITHFSISVVENRVNNNLKLQQVIIAESSPLGPAWASRHQDWDLDQDKFIPLKHQRCLCAYRSKTGAEIHPSGDVQIVSMAVEEYCHSLG